MPMPSKSVVLYDNTGGANASLDTGTLDVSDFDALLVEEAPVGGAAAASTLFMRDPGNGAQPVVGAMATSADANPNIVGWGVGVGGGAMAGSLYYKGGVPGPLPPTVSFSAGPLGVGISVHLRVVGRRNFRGSVAVNTSQDGLTPRVLD